jgi:hypothetical protein
VNTIRFIVIVLITIALAFLAYYFWSAANSVSVLVEWTTASELDTAGFNLYRGDSNSGPFTQVNQELIPASTDPLAGSAYSYKDTQVRAGRTYYYQLEEVEVNGTANRFGPISVTAESPYPDWLVISVAAVTVVLLIIWRWLRSFRIKELEAQVGRG